MPAEEHEFTRTKELLARWARWWHANNHGGYPIHSWEGRAQLRGGAAPVMRPSAIHIYQDPDAERVNTEINRMPTSLRETIQVRWLLGGGERGKAKLLGCSRAAFRTRVLRAHYYLIGRFSVS